MFFFVFPFKIGRKYNRFPCITVILIITNVTVSFITLSELETIARNWGASLNTSFYLTWFTHQFLHSSISHLLFNMYFLWLFGSFIEDILGRIKFISLYLSGGLIAALAHFIALSKNPAYHKFSLSEHTVPSQP